MLPVLTRSGCTDHEWPMPGPIDYCKRIRSGPGGDNPDPTRKVVIAGIFRDGGADVCANSNNRLYSPLSRRRKSVQHHPPIRRTENFGYLRSCMRGLRDPRSIDLDKRVGPPSRPVGAAAEQHLSPCALDRSDYLAVLCDRMRGSILRPLV